MRPRAGSRGPDLIVSRFLVSSTRLGQTSFRTRCKAGTLQVALTLRARNPMWKVEDRITWRCYTKLQYRYIHKSTNIYKYLKYYSIISNPSSATCPIQFLSWVSGNVFHSVRHQGRWHHHISLSQCGMTGRHIQATTFCWDAQPSTV